METDSVRLFTCPINKDGDKFYIHRNGITIAVRCHDVKVNGDGVIKGTFELAYPSRHIVDGYISKSNNTACFHDLEYNRDAYVYSPVFLTKEDLISNNVLYYKWIDFINPYANASIVSEYSSFYMRFYMINENNQEITRYKSQENFYGKVSNNNELFLISQDNGKMLMKVSEDRFRTERDCKEYLCKKRRESQVYDFDDESTNEQKVRKMQVIVDGKVIIEAVFGKSILV